jgi:hypothetical protein
MPPVEIFDWDDDNLFHCSTEHRLGPVKVDQVRDTRCLFFLNHADQRATHLMIGPDRSGTIWTIAISAAREAGHWYVHTGFESGRRELDAYYKWIGRLGDGDFGEEANDRNAEAH